MRNVIIMNMCSVKTLVGNQTEVPIYISIIRKYHLRTCRKPGLGADMYTSIIRKVYAIV